jgi:hypothetical protein
VRLWAGASAGRRSKRGGVTRHRLGHVGELEAGGLEHVALAQSDEPLAGRSSGAQAAIALRRGIDRRPWTPGPPSPGAATPGRR